VRKRRNILKELGAYERYAGVSLLAPKEGDRVPQANDPYSHAHTFLWIPGEVSAEDFYPLVKRHIKHVEGATEENHPLDEAVSVQIHDSSEVKTPSSVKARGADLDRERGPTTALPQELGANLPLLRCRFDARGAPEYIEEWCAHLRLGTDGERSTRGTSRFRKLGRYEKYANSLKWQRQLQSGVAIERALSGLIREK
jgi:hypothetical protein